MSEPFAASASSPPTFSPSGRQFLLSEAGQELVVVEVGGGIRTYRSDGVDVLDGYEASVMCTGGRGELLVPWPNRVGDGRWEWEGVTYQLPINEPEHGNAIHGLARWLPWTAEEEGNPNGGGSSRLRMRCRLHPQPGWPWQLELAVAYELGASGLTVTTSVTNAGGPGPCPIGIGWHPYVAAFGGLVDDLVLHVPAATSYLTDERGLPVSKEPVDGTDDDFRTPSRVGRAKLDVAFTDLDRDSSGRAAVEVRSVGGEQVGAAGTRIWMDSQFTHLMVYTGDTLPEEGRRRRGIAIEPMSCAPDMLRSQDGMLVLPEGSTFEAAWGVETFKI
ncbi:MAG TPA: aldose 1-epimerase family protein [Acidimicrobiales bacterium]|nr:aldose 1-epimerase family protein [Acidimicrobiales bacterium]